MKISIKAAIGIAIFVLMLTGAIANAQAANKNAADPAAPTNEKRVRTTSNIKNAQSNPYFQENSNQGDMPTRNRRDSAAGQQPKSTGNMQGAQANPLYKENKSSGTNPLYEASSDDSDPSRHHASGNTTTNVQPPASNISQETVQYKDPEDRTTRNRPANNEAKEYQEGGKNDGKAAPYKDPEDMTTRYRPGNNKTTRTVAPNGPSSSPGVVEYKDGEDGVSHTRPSNPK